MIRPDPHALRWPKPFSGGRGARSHARPAPEILLPSSPASEPTRPEPMRAKPKLRLSNPRWLEPRGEYGERATACVDAEVPPTAATRVLFKAWAEWGRGHRLDLPDGEGHIGPEGGAVKIEFSLDPPRERGATVAACRYRFSAKHSLSDPVTSGPLEAGPGKDEPFAGLIYYCPARDEYLVLPAEKDVLNLVSEANRIESLRERAMLAWENPDPGGRGPELREVEKEAENLFGGTGNGRTQAALLELIQVGGNPRWGDAAAWTRVRAHERNGGATAVDAYWRKATDKQVRKELDRLLSPGGRGLSSLLKSRCKAHLFGTEPKAGDAWHWTSRPAGASGKTDKPARFVFTPEAALGRYFAGWNGGEVAYETEKKKLRLGASGSAELALFEGKVGLAVELPDPGGLNLVAWLGAVKFRDVYLADPRRACQLKLRVTGSLSAFVGGTVQGALSLTGTFAKIPKAKVGSEAYAFAGAQGNAACEGSLHWAPARTGPFAALASLTGGIGASAGLGGEAGLRVEYEDGVFRFKMSAELCLGLGLKDSSLIEVEVREGAAMLGHLFACVDFHFVEAVSKEAFAAFRNHAFSFFTGEHFLAEDLRSAATGLGRIKAAILSRVGERSRLRRTPPEAMGRLLATLMESREAGDFQGIRFILGSCACGEDGTAARVPPDHKLKWVLRCVSARSIPEADGPEREAEKAAALEDGIRILREFSTAEGKWKDEPGQRSHGEFTAWLEGFLAANGIRSRPRGPI